MQTANQSRIKMFRRCQKQYSYRYDTAGQLGLDPTQEMVRKVHKAPLYRGSWMHALLEAHHREWAGLAVRGSWEEVHEQWVEDYEKLFEEERLELGDLPSECYRLFQGYLRFWKEDPTLAVANLKSGEPAIEFMIEMPLKKWTPGWKFKGRVDLMVEDQEFGGLWVLDHKWVKRIPDADERMMSPQNVMYVWALRKLGYDIRGFVYNYGRTKAPTVPRILKKGTLSLAQKMDTDYYTYLGAIKELHGEYWKNAARTMYRDKLLSLKGRETLWYRRERIPVEPGKIKEGLAEFIVTVRDIERRSKKHPPRSYFYNCKFGCEYHDLCCAEFAGFDIEDLIDADFTFDEERYSGQEDLLKD